MNNSRQLLITATFKKNCLNSSSGYYLKPLDYFNSLLSSLPASIFTFLLGLLYTEAKIIPLKHKSHYIALLQKYSIFVFPVPE